MNIIPLINDFTNTFNEIFCKNLNPLNLESKIRQVGDDFTLKLYESFLNYIDYKFKNSKERKLEFNVKETRQRTLITSVGCITVNSTSYYHKITKKRFVLLREILYLNPYQRLTNEAEYQLTKYAMSENMSQSARHALRNTTLSRSTVSKKLGKLDGSINENITRSINQPDILYIEMDEIHANLQHGGNKICPAAIVHEGYEEDFVKRKKLKNIRYFASSKLSYEELWEVIFDYVDKKYDIDKFKIIFVSGDGASGIKNFQNCFPKAKFVLDPFHYIRKHLNYIFKNDFELRNIADDYVRNNLIDDFKSLVLYQIKKYPEQEKYIKEHMNYILNNLEGIKNQNHEDYKVHCSMEGHISNKYARFITSRPHSYSEDGLENVVQLLTMKANKIKLTEEIYHQFKTGKSTYKQLNLEKYISNFRNQANILINPHNKYNILYYVDNTNFSLKDNYRLDYFLSKRI